MGYRWHVADPGFERARARVADGCRGVHEVAIDAGPVAAAGRTDGAIVRDLLRASGVSDERIDARAADVLRCAVEIYDPGDLSANVAFGARDVLAGLAGVATHGLVTGNSQQIARRKLAAAGLGEFFDSAPGGFGDDAEDRAELPAIARERAGGWSRDRTIVIGDTPNDIACARADGIGVIAVSTGPFSATELADADFVVSDLREAPPIIAATHTACAE